MDRPRHVLEDRPDDLLPTVVRSRRCTPASGQGDYRDTETGEVFWVSGVKRLQRDRHWVGRDDVEIDDDVREEYERLVSDR